MNRQLKLIDKPIHNIIDVQAMDEPGPGGACHEYEVRFVAFTRDAQGEPQPVPAPVRLYFQKGPVNEVGVNGVSDEALLAVLIDRARAFANGPFKSREGSLAATKMEEAMHWLRARYEDRAERGVEGYTKV